MDNTTSTNDATSTTPFPAHDGTGDAARATPSPAKPAEATEAAAPIVDRLIKRATSSAHDAVDGIAAKVSSVADGLQGGVSKVGDTRDDWVEAARDAIREHPLATVAGALVVGAALLSLMSSRRD